MSTKCIGDYEISERGIERIIDVGECGAYTTQLIMSKEAFKEAYKKWIVDDDEEQYMDNISNIDFEQVKEIFKQCLEVSDVPSELFKNVLNSIYQEGYKKGKECDR